MSTTKHTYVTKRYSPGNISCPRCDSEIQGFRRKEQRSCAHCSVVLRRSGGMGWHIYAVDNEMVEVCNRRISREYGD